MTPNRTTTRLATGVLVLLAAVPAFAQDLQGVQLGAPAEISPYERGPQPHEGYFFSVDALYWSISRPRTTMIGSPNTRIVAEMKFDSTDPITQGPDALLEYREFFSAEDTSRFTSKFRGGERIELGRVEDGQGWMVSFFKLRDQNQGFLLGTVDVNFDDPLVINQVEYFNGIPNTFPYSPHHYLFGQIGNAPSNSTTVVAADLPVTFSTLNVQMQTQLWNVEMSYIRRLKPLHHGCHFEWFLGGRYTELNDTFFVHGTGGLLDESEWENKVENHVFGPQIGARLSKQSVRLIFNSELRFLAGYNRQNYHLHGFLASNSVGSSPGASLSGDPDTALAQQRANIAADSGGRPVGWAGSDFSSHELADAFSGVGELRFDLRYVLTRNIDVRVGWTGMWMGNVGRATTSLIYQVPTMQIDALNNHENVFVHGIYVGVDVNR